VTGQPDVIALALRRFAHDTRLANVPESTAERARDVVRSCLVAGSWVSASELGADTYRVLANIDHACSGADLAPDFIAAASLGSPRSLSRSRSVAYNSACLALASAELHGGSDGLTAIVFPAVIAASDVAGADGASMLTGFIVGMEIGLRLAKGMRTRRPESGWHVPTVVGRIAAATAVVKVLGGGEREIHEAIGLGATQAAGLAGACPGSAAGLIVGKAASDGFEAGVLAMTDWDGPVHPLDGDRAFFSLLSGGPAPRLVCEGLGSTWLLDTEAIPLTSDADDSTRALVDSRIASAGSIERLTGAHIAVLLESG
jgi:2-methylcitrate dehydratase PrpD